MFWWKLILFSEALTELITLDQQRGHNDIEAKFPRPKTMTFHPYISDFQHSCFWDQNAKLCLSTFQWEVILYSPLSYFITFNSTSKKRYTKRTTTKFIEWSKSSRKFGGAYDKYQLWFLGTLLSMLDSGHLTSKSAEVSNASLSGDKFSSLSSPPSSLSSLR